MSAQDSATPAPWIAARHGATLAALGVLGFSFTFPATSWALDGFGPWTATGLRGVLAALVAGTCLAAGRVPVPERRHWPGLLTVAAGCVIGFPLLTTLALRTSSTAHSAVVIGVLPLATAAVSVVRTGERPPRPFWYGAVGGAAAVIGFALEQSHGAPTVADLYLFAALLVCAAGYTEGGRLARHMPGWQVIAWGVVAALPITAAAAFLALPAEPVHLTGKAVVGMLYVAAVSQFGGFVLWYRGMAAIGVARASQLQLSQPLLTLLWSVLLMGEHLSPMTPVAALAVLLCVVSTQRARA
ncbi:Permease of the drug/metabolite transporter (DMT) superfamily [Actinacidiphila yanglinensis]|uniref:Permease of the drug/metabolite transporter (DMT) superfamily n=1 Tax=Actinacidiphila yanglinensis TaxID=310779 RepID=A0A1H6DAM2_9ACTN|nr:DMT family transporter [Actinacidiphila yanglinensis]SEG82381.1 Permease of the drug/metabolite transporter (DMT) superfamily [Actinacidiphila yanglinensis]